MPRDLPRARPPPGSFPRPPRALPPGLSPPPGYHSIGPCLAEALAQVLRDPRAGEGGPRRKTAAPMRACACRMAVGNG